MPEIHERTSQDIIGLLPKMIRLEQAKIGRIDVLITAAGFEDRATAICAITDGVPVRDHLVITYPTNRQDNESSLRQLSQLPRTGVLQELAYERSEFRVRVLAALQAYGTGNGTNVVIDISGMSSYAFFRLMPACVESLPDARLGIFYAEARDYYPEEVEWREFLSAIRDPSDALAIAREYASRPAGFQSRGVDIVYESECFLGSNQDGLPVKIVAFPNFSLERMKSMLSFCEQQFNALGRDSEWCLGQPPDVDRNGWRPEALRQLYLIAPDRLHSLSTLTYQETLRKLDDLWEKHYEQRHIIVATLGSKMQHLGVLLFLLMHREVGLVLSEPAEFFAGRFSTGVGSRWWLDCGTICDLVRLLASRGELSFVW